MTARFAGGFHHGSFQRWVSVFSFSAINDRLCGAVDSAAGSSISRCARENESMHSYVESGGPLVKPSHSADKVRYE